MAQASMDRIWDLYSSEFLQLYKDYNPQDWIIKHSKLNAFNYQRFLSELGPGHKFKDATEFEDVYIIETIQTCGDFSHNRLYFVINPK